MEWLSYYNQAYELDMAICSIKAKSQTSGDSVRAILRMTVEYIVKRRDELIQMGDRLRAISEKSAGSNPSRPADGILRQPQIDYSAGDGTEAKSAG